MLPYTTMQDIVMAVTSHAISSQGQQRKGRIPQLRNWFVENHCLSQASHIFDLDKCSAFFSEPCAVVSNEHVHFLSLVFQERRRQLPGLPVRLR